MTDNGEVQSIEVGRFVAALRRRWRLALGVFLVVMAMAGAFLAVVPRQVTATTIVKINTISDKPFASDRPASALVDPSTEQQIARSTTVLSAAKEELGTGLTVSELRAATTISPIPASTIVRVAYAARNRDAAIEGANAIADAYLAQRGTAAAARVASILQRLGDRRDAARSDLLAARQTEQRSVPGSRAALEAAGAIEEYTLALSDLVSSINAFNSIDTSGGAVEIDAGHNTVYVSPSTTLVLGAGLAMGLVFAIASALVRQAFSRKILDAEEVRRAGGGPVLAQVRGGDAELPATESDADEFRALRERLLARLPDDPALTVVDMTAQRRPSDVAPNLAYFLAESGRATCLVLSGHSEDSIALLRERLALETEGSSPGWKILRSRRVTGLQVLLPVVSGADVASALHADLGKLSSGRIVIVAVPQDAPHSVRLAAARLGHSTVLAVSPNATLTSSVSDLVRECVAVRASVAGSVLVPASRTLEVGAASDDSRSRRGHRRAAARPRARGRGVSGGAADPNRKSRESVDGNRA